MRKTIIAAVAALALVSAAPAQANPVVIVGWQVAAWITAAVVTGFVIGRHSARAQANGQCPIHYRYDGTPFTRRNCT